MDTRDIFHLMNNEIITPEEKNNEIKTSLRDLRDPSLLDRTFQNMTPLMEAANLGDVQTVKELLDAKANVNAHPQGCLMPALHWAAHSGKSECVKLLIDAKANINAMNHVNFGLSPLSLSAGLVADTMGDSSECVRLLLAAGAEINFVNPNEIHIPNLYLFLSKCSETEELTKKAFRQLLLLNQKEKEKLRLGKNNWVSVKKLLLPEEIGRINILLGEGGEEMTDGLINKDPKSSVKVDPVGMRCLMM